MENKKATHRVRLIDEDDGYSNSIQYTGSEKECIEYLKNEFSDLKEEFKGTDYHLDYPNKKEVTTELTGYGHCGTFRYEVEEITFEMDLKTRNNLIEIMDYLADEDNHFWENCECSDEIQESEDVKLCKCEANKVHIWRYRAEVIESLGL